MAPAAPEPEPSELEPVAGGIFSLSGDGLKELVRETGEKGASLRFKARGSSMSPFIKDGDVITISPLVPGELKCGAVCACAHPETHMLVVHRIVRVTPRGLWFRGDSAPYPDGCVSVEDVLGVLTHVERGGRRVHLGNGPERALLAALSRAGLLRPLAIAVARLTRPFRRSRHARRKESEI
jgi:hypothetical protein